MNTLWILTEERPKSEVIEQIFIILSRELHIAFFCSRIMIIPIIEDGFFTFTYQVIGINNPSIPVIKIKIVSGIGSFVDYLIFLQKTEPVTKDIPILAIEETKTDDSESRNTGVYQRCTKFIIVDLYYPNIKKIMLYSLKVAQKVNISKTNIFGNRLLTTYGVEIEGKILKNDQFIKFNSIDELITFKNSMRKAPKGNVPININKVTNDIITISGRLCKNNLIAHDPNIGALCMIAAVLRKLGWLGRIIITNHGITQDIVKKICLNKIPNKFLIIAKYLSIELDGIFLHKNINNFPNKYWHYELSGEKLATIFIDLAVENFTNGYSIFSNHAGCEKSYFMTNTGEPISLKKYSDQCAYKSGDKSKIVHIPDLMLVDLTNCEIINIEGKKYENMDKGIKELKLYDDIENIYVKKYYPKYTITRTVVLYGSNEETNKTLDIKVGFMLSKQGRLILGIKAPKLFIEATKNLLSYWRSFIPPNIQ